MSLSRNVRRFIIGVLTLLATLALLPKAWGQAASGLGGGRVDLDDVSIQGELLSDDRIRLLARARNSLAGQIKVRSSFREEILEHLPTYFIPVESNPEP